MEKVTNELKWTLELDATGNFNIALGHDGSRLAAAVLKFKDNKFHAWTYTPYSEVGVFDSMKEGMQHFGFSTEVTSEQIAEAMIELGFAPSNAKVGA